MKRIARLLSVFFSLCPAAFAVVADAAESTIGVTRIVYQEAESDIAAFENHYLVTQKFLRISDPSDDSGYILFDVDERKIYSVSHHDRSILVIPEYPLKEEARDYRAVIDYGILEGAPQIDGRPVYSYRASAAALDGGELQVCADIQLVPGLLPEAAGMLRSYMQVMSSQQEMNLEKTPSDMRTPCLLQDTVFNKGEYYLRGLPVQEWHSSGKRRLLRDFGQVEVRSSLFELPPDYRRFSIP